MNRIALSAVAAIVLLGAAGCSTGVPATSGGTASPSSSSPAATAAPSPSQTKKSVLSVKFGETVEYADGIKVTVEHAGAGVASGTAAPSQARGAEYQLFKITIVNGTEGVFDPALFYETAVHGTAGTPAEKVFDSAASIGGGNFSGLMTPNTTQTVTAGWLIPTADLSTTIFTVRPSFEHKASVVTGGL